MRSVVVIAAIAVIVTTALATATLLLLVDFALLALAGTCRHRQRWSLTQNSALILIDLFIALILIYLFILV